MRLIGELRIVLGDTRLSETIDRQIALTVVLVVATLLAALVSSLIAHRTAIGLPSPGWSIMSGRSERVNRI